MIDLQLNVISIVAVLFVVGLFGLIMLTSLLRRVRHFLVPIPHNLPANNPDSVKFIPSPVPAPPPADALNRRRTQSATVVRPLTAIPDSYRLQPQPAAPEQIILSIEPADGPTRDQRNVQKLIEFLKREGVQPVEELTELAS